MFSIINSFSQCKKGNCINGNGTFDFGWCVYSGEFKNSKPEGKGTMKYDDYSYSGNFTNGLENGEGIITNNNGTIENVKYENGIKQVSHLEKIAAKDYKPLNPQNINCISGNCIDGFGTLQYASGNKYIGNFNRYKLDGKGVFYFSNGDKFDGVFSKNIFNNGIYTYNSGANYTGTYDTNGKKLNGTITSSSGMSISYINGKAIIPPKPTPQEKASINESSRDQSSRIHIPNKVTCSACGGQGYRIQQDNYGRTGRGQCSVCGGCGYSYN